jgi:hypothetical protein
VFTFAVVKPPRFELLSVCRQGIYFPTFREHLAIAFRHLTPETLS